MRLIITVILCTLLYSCAVSNMNMKYYPPLEDLIKEDVEKQIMAKDYLPALQDLLGLKDERNILSQQDISDLQERILTQLKSHFFQLMDIEDFRNAYNILLSFESLGLESQLLPWNKKDLLLAWAKFYLDHNESFLALLKYDDLLKEYALSSEDLTRILDLSVEEKQPLITQSVLEKLKIEAATIDDKYRNFTYEPESKEMMNKGTVIVWVDKGIRLENGYGIADRVLGSGFFIDKRGYLLTNHHVIASEVDSSYEGFSRLYIRLSEDTKERIPAKVIGYDRVFDLALLKVELEPDYVFPLPFKIDFKLGEKVQAIGAPVGLENTLTQGILSNVSRRFIQMGDVIQVDAPINHGNSGGPLLNSQDQLLGVVFAGLEMFEGLNFAIPYNYVKKLLPQLYQGGEISHSFLGLAVDEIDKVLEVVYVMPDSSSYRAGLKKQDRILSINGHQFSKISAIQNYLLSQPIGALVNLEIQRMGHVIEKYIVLKDRPFSPVENSLKIDKRENLFLPLFGMAVDKVGNFLWETNYVVDQVLRGSVADNSGISEGDPMNIQSWRIDDEYRAAVLQMFIKKRKAGYYDSVIQIAAYLETNNFI